MNVSKLYVPDISRWIDFYKNNYLQNKKRNIQFGGSIVGGVKTRIKPIEDNKKIEEPERQDIKNVPIKIRSPSHRIAHNNTKRAKAKTNQKNNNKRSKDIFD